MTDTYNPYLPDGPGKPAPTVPGLPIFFPTPRPATRRRPGRRSAGGPADAGVEEALKSVTDPEIPVNIFDLGLIYGRRAGQR